jgi:hypothetical protein
MAGYSVESLLAWMKDTPRLFGWDGVMAVSSDKVNAVLQQGYKTQLSEGIAHQVPSGHIDIADTDISYYFSHFILGAPVLLFESGSFDIPTFPVQMPVVSGVLTQVETILGVARVLRLSAYEPTNGPLLRLQLRLSSEAGKVDVDLALGEEPVLLFPGAEHEKERIGEFFQAWLRHPDNEGRVYPLSVFTEQGNTMLAVRRVDIRTQLEDANSSQPEKKGAVLFFLTTEYGVTGAFPGNEGDIRYLIPNDAQPVYSATSLFSQPVLYRAAFGNSVLQLLEGAEFRFDKEPAEPLRQMTALAGSFQVAAGHYRGTEYEFQSEPFTVSAAGGQQPLTVTFESAKASQTWQFPCTVTFSYRAVGGTQWTPLTASFNVSLRHEFLLWADESGARALEGQLFSPYGDDQEVTPVSGLPGNLDPLLLQQIKGFIAYTIKGALLERFSQTLNTTATESFVEQWTLAGEQRVQPLVKALPHDLAMFGQVGAAQDGLHIVEQSPLLLAGASLQFTTEPPGQGLRWSLENAPGSEGNPGTITADGGLYRAPPAHTMAQGLHRVLVVVRDASNRVATALVTIQAYGVSIDPLIEVCNYGESVTLTAGVLGDGVPQWSIKNRVEGESGELIGDDPQGDRTYVAHGDVSGKSYVLDEIEVRDSLSGQARSAWMLVIQSKGVGLHVRPRADASPVAGQIQLEAVINGTVQPDTQWRLGADSPGEISTTGGLYISDPLAPQRFVLILAEVDIPTFGRFEGYLILPLPLNDFPDVLAALGQ